MNRTVIGVGYNDGCRFERYTSSGKSPAYQVWHNMLLRCYDPKVLVKYDSYAGCTVADEWHNFQNFAEWFYSQENSQKGFELDKDLSVIGNRVYSPEFCCMVPRPINALLINCKKNRGHLPVGVTYDKSKGKYQARLSKRGKVVRLGLFNNPDDAFLAYKSEKELHIKEMAVEFRSSLPDIVYRNLMNWSIKKSG